MRTTALLVLGLLASAVLTAQTPPAFEVASIRPSDDQPVQANIGVKISGSQVRLSYLSLRDYISQAYRMRSGQIVAPEWLSQTRFDIAAKLPDGSSAAQVFEMLQTLLAERFELKIHRAMQEFPVYALTATKDGPKVSAIVDTSDTPAAAPGTVNVAASGSAAGIFMDLGGGASVNLANNRLDVRKVTMAQLVEGLTRIMDRPVINGTTLDGRYSFTVDLTEGDYRGSIVRSGLNQGVLLPPQALRALDFASSDPFSPTLHRYGLTLEPQKTNLEVIVVDSMRKTPKEN
jgi:uncharacterized protein (TIGR03435 family)